LNRLAKYTILTKIGYCYTKLLFNRLGTSIAKISSLPIPIFSIDKLGERAMLVIPSLCSIAFTFAPRILHVPVHHGQLDADSLNSSRCCSYGRARKVKIFSSCWPEEGATKECVKDDGASESMLGDVHSSQRGGRRPRQRQEGG
jgi:hypothetical protein